MSTLKYIYEVVPNPQLILNNTLVLWLSKKLKKHTHTHTLLSRGGPYNTAERVQVYFLMSTSAVCGHPPGILGQDAP